MLDGRRNGVAFKDPNAFAEWLDAVTEPRFMTALASVAMEPGTYPKILADAIDPAAARNWAEFTDPLLFMRWAMASGNPSFQRAIVSKMTDPAKLKRWVEAGMRPDTLSPIWTAAGRAPVNWMAAASNPATYAPAMKMMQPMTPVNWFNAMAGDIGKPAGHDKPGEWKQLPTPEDGKTTQPALRYRY